MTDRELLELAAKAAGHEQEWTHNKCEIRIENDWVEWNPLTDDGDALRLAVRLGIDLMLAGEIIGAFDNIEKQHAEKRGTDPYAATRRAIVKAAAAIGVRHHDRH